VAATFSVSVMLCATSITLASLQSLSERSNQTNPARPTMCRSCGAIVGAGETQCAVCGAQTSGQSSQAAAAPPPAAEREAMTFARAVLNRPNKFTFLLLIANVFVFLLMWESSGTTSTVLWQGFEGPVLETYGAKLNYLINAPNYQWWRFIAPMFIHVNLIHLFVNMYSLLMVGPFVEKFYGPARFVVFWILTGIAGVVASYLTVQPRLATGVFGRFIFKAVDNPSAGASGALFGLVGVLFVFGIKFRRELPEGFKRAFGTGLLPIILINLFIGFAGRMFIDNAAHLGGLLSGAALALVVDYKRPGVSSRVTTVWRVFQILCLSLVALTFYQIARNFNRPPAAPATMNASTLIFLNYVGAMNQLQEKVSAVIYRNDRSNVAAVAQKAIQAPAPDERSAELRNRLIAILSKLNETEASGSLPDQEPGQPPQLDQEVVAEYAAWRKEYGAWFKEAAKAQPQ
jgi:rhomboid protease GluP